MGFVPIYRVNAFTDQPFGGNPAAVCVLSEDDPARFEDGWMQRVAAEMNLSETAFLHPQNGGYRLRWFTPMAEVDLCGHATLAAAHALWESGAVDADRGMTFHTRSGALGARRGSGMVWLDFPAEAVRQCPIPPGLGSWLGAEPIWVGKNRMDLLVEVPSSALVRSLQPDMSALAALPVRGVIVTAKGDSGYDFVSRFFAPRFGIPEDPVTGSAHCALAPFWGERTGKAEMTGYQASLRGGVVQVINQGVNQGVNQTINGSRVALGGHAVTVLKGELVGP